MTAQASYCWHFQIQLSDIKHGLAFKTANPAEMGGGAGRKVKTDANLASKDRWRL